MTIQEFADRDTHRVNTWLYAWIVKRIRVRDYFK